MRPSASKTPAERSPASRTEVENAVRTKVCACSSTTAMSRLHMICAWICESAAFERLSMLHQPFKEISPLRVQRFDQRQFLFARSSLDLFLTFDRAHHNVVPFVPDEEFAAISFGEACRNTLTMLPSAFKQIGRDAGIERLVSFICHYIDRR